MTDYKELPYDQLKSLHREIGTLLVSRRQEELGQLRIKIAELGFTAQDLAAPKSSGRTKSQPKYRDPDNPANTYGGKGKRPQWLNEALESGRRLEEFEVT